ncbi:MAG: signal recognition particle receptor subunit alpha, partial [Rhodospirillaceae bacterium]
MSADGGGWLSRLKSGLSRSSEKIAGGITGLFTKRKLDQAALDELEDVLIAGDLGVETAARLSRSLANQRFDQEITPDEVRSLLADAIAGLLDPVARPLAVDAAHKPFVVLVCGVNGSGKTTTIGKLTKQFRDQGKSVILAAGDTFRAAAVEQLQVWGERAGAPVVTGPERGDAAGLAFGALERARA